MLYRVYFNAHADFPLVWSIDTGDDSTEINVKSITIIGGNCKRFTSHYRPERQPKAWFEIQGKLVILDEHATIEVLDASA
jgi:hypothetical protein